MDGERIPTPQWSCVARTRCGLLAAAAGALVFLGMIFSFIDRDYGPAFAITLVAVTWLFRPTYLHRHLVAPWSDSPCLPVISPDAPAYLQYHCIDALVLTGSFMIVSPRIEGH